MVILSRSRVITKTSHFISNPQWKLLNELKTSQSAQRSCYTNIQPNQAAKTYQTTSTSSTVANPNNILFAATVVSPSVSSSKLLLAFIAGGLFFSTILATVTACYGMGMKNTRRMANLSFVLVKVVWSTFCRGMGAAKLALRGDISEAKKTPLEWKTAWEVFKKELGETRRTAVEGVQALQKEAKKYEAAIGAPGLIPLQHALDRLMPLVISNILEEALRESLSELPSQKTIKKIDLRSFNAGSIPPELQSARVYDVPDSIAFDYDVDWKSELEAKIQVSLGGLYGPVKIPISLKRLNFKGVVRVILTPLTEAPPGFGAILLSMPSLPEVGLDIRVFGSEVTKLSFLRKEISNGIQNTIKEQFLWPRRVVVPSKRADNKDTILTTGVLKALEDSDPLLDAENALLEHEPMLRELHEQSDLKLEKDNLQIVVTAENETMTRTLNAHENSNMTHVDESSFQEQHLNQTEQVQSKERNNWDGMKGGFNVKSILKNLFSKEASAQDKA